MPLPHALPAVRPTEVGFLDPRVLSGSWFVTRTSLPLWRKLDNPSVTYAPLPDGRLLDSVRATRRGRSQLIVGLDRPLGPGRFEWRGLAFPTRCTPSRWEVLAHDPEGAAWAVTVFARTLFTPAGLDIYSRSPHLLPDLELPVLRLLATLSEAQPHLDGLFTPHHD